MKCDRCLAEMTHDSFERLPRRLSAQDYAELRAIVIAQHDIVVRIDRLCEAAGLTRAQLFEATERRGTP